MATNGVRPTSTNKAAIDIATILLPVFSMRFHHPVLPTARLSSEGAPRVRQASRTSRRPNGDSDAAPSGERLAKVAGAPLFHFDITSRSYWWARY